MKAKWCPGTNVAKISRHLSYNWGKTPGKHQPRARYARVNDVTPKPYRCSHVRRSVVLMLVVPHVRSNLCPVVQMCNKRKQHYQILKLCCQIGPPWKVCLWNKILIPLLSIDYQLPLGFHQLHLMILDTRPFCTCQPPLWSRGNVVASRQEGLGLIPGRVNFPGWGFFRMFPQL